MFSKALIPPFILWVFLLCSANFSVAWAAEEDAVIRGKNLVREIEAFSTDSRPLLKIDAGEYVILSGNRRVHLVLAGLKNKKIVGTGAKFLFADPHKGGILIVNSENFTLEGVQLDWQVKPFVVAQVSEVLRSGSEMKVKMKPRPDFSESVQHLAKAEDTWFTVHNPDGSRKLLVSRDPVWFKSPTVDVAGMLTVVVASGSVKVASLVSVGDWVVSIARHSGTHAILVDNSHGVSFQGVAIRSSPGMGIVSPPGSADIRIENCVIQAQGPERWISTDSDGIHLIGTAGLTVIRNNIIDGTQDDAIVVSERGSWGRIAGDRIDFRGDNSTGLSNAKRFFVVSREQELHLTSSVLRRQSGDQLQLSIASQPFSAKDGETVAVFREPDSSSSVLIEGNKVRNVRGTGIRVCRNNVQVRGNEVDLTVNWAITAGPYLFPEWHPQMPAIDVQITNNLISQPTLDRGVRDLRAVVEVSCLPLPWCSKRQLNHNVKVDGNRFSGGTAYARERIFVQ